ncbi:flagellar hook-length control protein FliK [uncultured Sphingomonas sp.]|uniref:flagellar hook-length control protein FliK n=1 Tax=uncultured Sphingomonas sp. TaxID=158754 RepID=UPI0025D5845B|nr:flagellar hook-length control protein FliK [uncultured Sphingomonas sp.]
MQLLSALSSTTSPLAMQAMPLVGTPAGDFAALIAGMVPAGDATAVTAPAERQAVAPTGNPLPVPLATPVALDGVVPTEAVAPMPPPLPVSATEAVLMLPQEATGPAATLVRAAAPVLVTATTGVLADVLPDEMTVETPPRAEDVAARVPAMPVPTRFAVVPPRTKRAEIATPDTPHPAHDEDGADSDQPTADAAVPIIAAPPIVPQPAAAIVSPVVAPVVVQAGDPAAASGDDPTPAAAPVIEGGEVVAAEPVSTRASPMRMAKRVDAPLPPATARRGAVVDRTAGVDKEEVASGAEPAIGRVTPLHTDKVVPVHVVVPPVADDAPVRNAGSAVLQPATRTPVAASSVVSPAMPMPDSAPVVSSVRPTGPVPTAGSPPVASVARGGLAGGMIDLLPVEAAAAVPAAQEGVEVVPATRADRAAAPGTVDVAPSGRATNADAIARSTAVPLPPGASAALSPSLRSPPPARTGFAPVAPAPRRAMVPDAAMVERDTIVSAPAADPGAAVPMTEAGVDREPTGPDAAVPTAQPAIPVPTEEAIAERPPIAREATAPIAPMASPPTMVAPAGEAVVTRQPIAPDAIVADATRPPTLAPSSSEAIADRPPIASEAAAPVVPVAAPAAQPTVLASPVTRIASLPISDAAPVTDANPREGDDSTPTVRRVADAPPGTPAVMPPVTRIAAAPVAEVAPVVVGAVLRDGDTPAPRARRDDDPAIPTTGAIAAPDAAVPRPVAPTAHAANPTLDTRQPQWVEGMIDRITTLREASDTNGGETRIRLSPDALGDVEVAIRTGDDGKLHVHFNSDNADAGRLLAEAQPRLVQMAEARGLKLGGMQVDVGSQQSGQPQRQAQDNPVPRAPRAATSQTNTQTTRSDDRIA